VIVINLQKRKQNEPSLQICSVTGVQKILRSSGLELAFVSFISCQTVHVFLCFVQLPTSTSFRSSISGLSTKRLTSTLNDRYNLLFCFYDFCFIFLVIVIHCNSLIHFFYFSTFTKINLLQSLFDAVLIYLLVFN
jgi:hypothetical protein